MKPIRHHLLTASLAGLAISPVAFANEEPAITGDCVITRIALRPDLEGCWAWLGLDPIPLPVEDLTGTVDEEGIIDEDTTGDGDDANGMDEDLTGDEELVDGSGDDFTDGFDEDLTGDVDFMAGMEEERILEFYKAFSSASGPSVVGGWEHADPAAPEVVAAARFAVGKLRDRLDTTARKARVLPAWFAASIGNDTLSKSELRLISVSRARQQVVAGVKYRLRLKVLYKGETKNVRAVVWNRDWLEQPNRLLKWSWIPN